jgi:hypothetical protein
VNQTIITAIRNLEQLTFSYDGLQRVVEPHTYGITTTVNNPCEHIKFRVVICPRTFNHGTYLQSPKWSDSGVQAISFRGNVKVTSAKIQHCNKYMPSCDQKVHNKLAKFTLAGKKRALCETAYA